MSPLHPALQLLSNELDRLIQQLDQEIKDLQAIVARPVRYYSTGTHCFRYCANVRLHGKTWPDLDRTLSKIQPKHHAAIAEHFGPTRLDDITNEALDREKQQLQDMLAPGGTTVGHLHWSKQHLRAHEQYRGQHLKQELARLVHAEEQQHMLCRAVAQVTESGFYGRSDGQFCFFTSTCDQHEDICDAAKRELLELGQNIEPGKGYLGLGGSVPYRKNIVYQKSLCRKPEALLAALQRSVQLFNVSGYQGMAWRDSLHKIQGVDINQLTREIAQLAGPGALEQRLSRLFVLLTEYSLSTVVAVLIGDTTVMDLTYTHPYERPVVGADMLAADNLAFWLVDYLTQSATNLQLQPYLDDEVQAWLESQKHAA